MPKKGENIHKRKDGRWEARIIFREDSGKVKYISVYGKSYREVKEKKMKVLSKQEFSKEKHKTVFADVTGEWLCSRHMTQKPSTRLKYKSLIQNHILPELGQLDIRMIDDVMINSFLSQKLINGRLDQKGGLSCSTVKTMSIVINSIFSYAVVKGYCKPLKTKIMKPTAEKKEICVLTSDMQNKFEEKLCHDPSLTALGIYMALNTGMRIGEICALKWNDIDLDNRLIRVRGTISRVGAMEDAVSAKTCLIMDKPKTRTSIRDIPVTSKLYEFLVPAKRKSRSEFVVSEKPDFISPRTFEYRYHRILEKYGMPNMNFHCLRHTFATRCIECNVDIKTLSEILGHSNVSITLNTYVHPSWELKCMQIERLSMDR